MLQKLETSVAAPRAKDAFDVRIVPKGREVREPFGRRARRETVPIVEVGSEPNPKTAALELSDPRIDVFLPDGARERGDADYGVFRRAPVASTRLRPGCAQPNAARTAWLTALPSTVLPVLLSRVIVSFITRPMSFGELAPSSVTTSEAIRATSSGRTSSGKNS